MPPTRERATARTRRAVIQRARARAIPRAQAEPLIGRADGSRQASEKRLAFFLALTNSSHVIPLGTQVTKGLQLNRIVSDTSFIALSRPDEKRHGLGMFRYIKKKFGRSMHQQIQDVIRGWCRGSFGFSDYYNILPPEIVQDPSTRIDDFVAASGSRRFINGPLFKRLSPLTREILFDKVATGLVLRAAGIPTPTALALYRTGGWLSDVPVLSGAEELAAFLRRPDAAPMFGKPLISRGSLGAISVSAYHPGDDTLELVDGRREAVETVAQTIAATYPDGFLLQRRIEQHPVVAAYSGNTVASVRFVTLNDGGTVEPAYAVWKIADPNATADNVWRAGNLVAAVDLATGRVTRGQQGSGPGAVLLDNHPRTGLPLVGLQLPDWPKMVETALAAARAFSDAPSIGWDIAFGADGPIVIEGNALAYHILYQLGHGRGALSLKLAEVAARVAAENAERRAAARTAARRAKIAATTGRIRSLAARLIRADPPART